MLSAMSALFTKEDSVNFSMDEKAWPHALLADGVVSTVWNCEIS